MSLFWGKDYREIKGCMSRMNMFQELYHGIDQGSSSNGALRKVVLRVPEQPLRSRLL